MNIWTKHFSNYGVFFFFNTCSRSLVCKVGGTHHVEPKEALRSISSSVVVATDAVFCSRSSFAVSVFCWFT